MLTVFDYSSAKIMATCFNAYLLGKASANIMNLMIRSYSQSSIINNVMVKCLLAYFQKLLIRSYNIVIGAVRACPI